MTRRWNMSVWAGFAIVIAAFVSYPTLFVRFAPTRDHPWVTLPLFALGLGLLARGLARAYRDPQRFRGRVAGPVLMVLGLAAAALFGVVFFYMVRQLPASGNAPSVGQQAPDFTLPDKDGNPVTLSKLVGPGVIGADRLNGVVLIFYRGFW